MKSKQALILSLMLGLFAVVIVHMYVAKKESDLQAGSRPQGVYVAAVDIPEHVRLSVDMVVRKELPSAYVQPQAATDLDHIVGSVSRVPIFKDTQITRNTLLTRMESALAMRIDPTRRAMSLAVSDVSGVAGLIQPGNRVDVYATFKLNKGDHETVQTQLLLPNIQVLAIERRVGAIAPEDIMSKEEHDKREQSKSTGQKEDYPKNITASVTPHEAVRAITAQESGALTVVLRPQFDDSPEAVVVTPVSTQDLIGREEKTIPRRVPRYEEIRGNEISY
jgi:pilus assembly protein CpaB